MIVQGKKKHSRQRARKITDQWLFKHLDLPAEVALYYGFSLMESPRISKEDLKMGKALTDASQRGKEPSDNPLKFSVDEKIAIFRLYEEKHLINEPQPVMLYFGKPIEIEGAEKKASQKERTVILEIMGAQKSIAEALLIKTSLEILKEVGYTDASVHLNTVGDKDSLSRFARELGAYYRKNIENLPAHCRQLMKRDILELLSCQNEKCRIIKENAPKSLSFLSEEDRQYFKEVLEYMEILEIPYEIDQFLVNNKTFCCQTVFEIHTAESLKLCQPLAAGVRYTHIGRKLGFKKDIPGIGVKLNFKEKFVKKNLKFLKPKIFFVQLGFEAKLKSLKIIEMLRQAKIPIRHGISRDKLASQLSIAESFKIPYVLIMGQKEALEETVIVRNMVNRSQESVKLEKLPAYLKKV